jgi:superfamily II DNA or RNA helicase
MEIELGILKSQIKTDNPDLLKTLRDLYSHKVKGAEFSPAYKHGTWNGKKDFITKSGYFRTGILPRVLEDLEKINCKPNLNINFHGDENRIWITTSDLGEYKLRSYQMELVSKALNATRCVVKSPTGSGKTLIMAALLYALKGKKAVIIFNAKQLLVQTYEFLQKCEIPDLGICFGEGYKYGKIMLTTVHSIEQVLDSHSEEAEVLMVDECHEFARGKRNLTAIEGFENAFCRIGFTATPPTDKVDLMSLEGALGPVVESSNTKELIEEDHLSKPIIQIFPISNEKDLTNLIYREVYRKHITEHEKRNNFILNITKQIKNSREKARILILVQSLDHANILQKLIPGAYKLEGYDHISTRYDIINQFLNEPESSVLIGTKILQSGINIEEISHFINARGLKSEIATLQALGRSLRKHDSKTEVYIYDFLDKVKYLETHARNRIKAYKKEGHEVEIL